MAQKIIDRGTKNNNTTGDSLWTGAGKINDNFTELYASGGLGDMTKAVYDPTTVAGDVFDMDNMVEGTSKILTIAERAEIAANTAKVSLDTNSVVEGKLAPQYKSASVISASDVDWSASQVYTKTLSGNTTLTFSNLYIGVKDLEITGNFTLALPAGFVVISGTYDGTVNNLIEVICTNSSTPTGWVVISQAA